jgi:hypothetical protein
LTYPTGQPPILPGKQEVKKPRAHRLRIGFHIRVVIPIKNVEILTAGEGPSWEYRAQTTSREGPPRIGVERQRI